VLDYLSGLGGGFSATEDWDGYVDEVLVFDHALSDTDAQTIYSRYRNGQNWNGTERSCGIPAPVANYPFDQCNWQGGRDVIDVSGNGLDAYSVNGIISTVGGQVCGLAQLDGQDDYIDVGDDPKLDIKEGLTVTSWFFSKEPATELKTILSKDTNYEFHLNSQGQVFWWWYDDQGVNRSMTSSQSVSLNQWHHIAIAYRSGLQRIYLDGVVIAESYYTGRLVTNNNPLQIGQDQGLGGRFFSGDLDELKIFDRYLSREHINQIMSNERSGLNYDGTLRSCNCSEPDLVDHYAIEHSGSMVSCMASEVVISAHDDANAFVDGQDREIVISTSSAKGEWLSVVSGSGQLINLGEGRASYRFPNNGESSVTLSFAYSELLGSSESINFDVTDGLKTDRRNSADSEDLNLQINATGLVFDIPDTESCLASSQVSVRAVRSTDQAMVCGAAFSGVRNASVLFDYQSPLTGTKSLLFTSNSQSNTLNAGSAVSRTLNFDANGEAFFNVEYADAGQVKLSLSVQGEYSTLKGSDLWVGYPSKLTVTATNASGSALDNSSTAGGLTLPAGEAFNLSVNAQCANGTATPNYQPSQAALSAVYQAPTIASGGSTGLLTTQSGNISVSDQTSWLNIASMMVDGRWVDTGAQFSEVGVISVSAKDDNYFGHAIAPIAQVVGRFRPAFFDLASTAPVFDSQCNASVFNYIGNWVATNQPLELLVTAKNAQGQTTYNYGNAFWKLSSAVPNRTYTDETGESNLTLEQALTAGGWYNTDQNYDGVGRLSLFADEVRYQKGLTPIIPFAGSLSHQFAVGDLTDAEGVCYKIDSDADGQWADEACAVFTTDNISLYEQRFGRLNIENGYGPETEWIPVKWLIEFYAAAGFIPNTEDSCSAFTESQLSFSDIDGNLSASGQVNSRFGYPGSDFRVEMGDAAFELSTDLVAGSQGVVRLDVDLSAMDYLTFDFDGDGVTDNPGAMITFGQYRSDDRVIFQRQY
jgi:MSHA biogenesis protein MshQ